MINKKELGQNWLTNRVILEEIAELAKYGVSLEPNDPQNKSVVENTEKSGICVEIGPGLGYLTTSLLRRFNEVIAVEFDADLAQKLPGSFPGTNLIVVNEDILKFDFESVKAPYVVAGNIPYYITSPIIRKVLTLNNKPDRVVLLVQKEVAERIISNKETVLSLFVKNHATVLAGPVVKKEEFTPPPKVDSQVIIMEPMSEPVVGEEVFDLIAKGFKAPRKKLVHNLAGIASKEDLNVILEKCGFSRDVRPGDVKLSGWAKLYHYLK